MEWKVEDMLVTKSKVETRDNYGYKKISYTIEDNYSMQEKIDIMDEATNGNIKYFIMLNTLYMEAFKNGEIKKNDWGSAKENSKKSWIRRYDTRHIFWNGKTKDNTWTDEYLSCSFFNYGHKWYFGYNVDEQTVNNAFNGFLKSLEKKEHQWFCENDEYEILKTKFREYGCPCFGANLSSCSDGNIYIGDGLEHEHWLEGTRLITKEELILLIDKYEQLKAYEEALKKDVNIVF